MREFIGFAFNDIICIDPETGELSPRSEVVLMASEPKWGADVGGLRTERVVGEHRFLVSPKGLRMMADACTKQADLLDKIGGIVGDLRAAVRD